MFNTVILSGRIASDPELKQTPNGTAVTSFSIAVDRPYKSGEDKKTDFFNVVAWRSTAEFICKYFVKGSAIGIEGRLEQRKWEDKDGNKRSTIDVIASNVHFFETKVKTDSGSPTPYSAKANEANFEEMTSDDDLPF